MHSIKTPMLLMSTLLMTVQTMRIDIKLDMSQENTGYQATDKLTTNAIIHRQPQLLDLTPEDDMEQILTITQTTHQLLEGGVKSKEDWEEIATLIPKYNEAVEVAYNGLDLHESNWMCDVILRKLASASESVPDKYNAEDMTMLADLACAAWGMGDKVGDPIMTGLISLKVAWGKWLGKFKNSCEESPYPPFAGRFVGKMLGEIGFTVGALSADKAICIKNVAPMEMK
ncbi:MAG: hypothetical protein M1816_002578 [Peltula sp. TS41687]|nr:MAG: hypothetical protein M1816_002578 [Peltula sp. TS41687]